MTMLALLQQITATYDRHGWQLQRILLRPETHVGLTTEAGELFTEAVVIDADFDALWFARPSHAGREAWELRLLAEQPYALFEAFGADQTESARKEVRQEMEARMREHTARRSNRSEVQSE